jgi:hypothetical protein
MPADRHATYPPIVVTDRPQNSQPRRVRVTVGGDCIINPGNFSNKTADLQTVKILFKIDFSTPVASFLMADIKDL